MRRASITALSRVEVVTWQRMSAVSRKRLPILRRSSPEKYERTRWRRLAALPT